MISKKNIRYLGTLYSINEQNATVALQNVKSFGTEGRPTDTPVAPSDDVHPFLLFRGQDITDLHVHEDQPKSTTGTANTTNTPAPPAPAPAPAPPKQTKENHVAKASAPTTTTTTTTTATTNTTTASANNTTTSNPSTKKGGPGRGGSAGRHGKPRGPRPAPGTGASLLHRHARGATHDNQNSTTQALQEDFDFASNLQKFQHDQEHHDQDDNDEEDAGDQPHASYEKGDFFDSISCDATDRQSGVDNRLRGKQERNLNTETFGAVALSQNRRRRGGAGGGRSGRGRGRGGRGRGRGRAGRGGYHHSRRDDGMPGRQTQQASSSYSS